MSRLSITPSAVEDYRSRVARRGATEADAQRNLVDAFARPLFSIPASDGATLHGLADPEGRRFLALASSVGDVVAIGPPHHWAEARAAWKGVGWDVANGRPLRTKEEAGRPSPPGQGIRKGVPKPGNFVDLGPDVPAVAEVDLAAIGARRRLNWEARVRDLPEARRIVEAHGGTVSDAARRKMDRSGDA